MRERAKWERETVSNTPERGFSSSRAPGWRGSTDAPAGTYAVVTLMIAWARLGSTPPQAATRRGGGSWWWQDGNRDRDGDNGGFSVENRCVGVWVCVCRCRFKLKMNEQNSAVVRSLEQEKGGNDHCSSKGCPGHRRGVYVVCAVLDPTTAHTHSERSRGP